MKILNCFFWRNKPASGDKIYVTMDWDPLPITTKGDSMMLPRKAELIFNRRFYPTGKVGEWPHDPITREKLPIEPPLIL